MAPSFTGSNLTSPEGIKPNTSRRRHNGGISRPDSRSRGRPQSVMGGGGSSRNSPQRSVHRGLPLQELSFLSPNTSTHSLIPTPPPPLPQLDHHHIQLQGITMERTPSGNSIMSEPPSFHSHCFHPHQSHHSPHPYQNQNLQNQKTNKHTLLYRDSQAADRVINHFSRLPPTHKHLRILHGLIRPRTSMEPPPDLDDSALAGLLTTMDSVFFAGALSSRVKWEWSSAPQYHSQLIGTTALRKCKDRDGYETLIVLSEPILRDKRYDRRLLISAFLHELVHCYLFVMCGFEAREGGGHTKGFERIVRVVDEWVGRGWLCLCEMRARLEYFRKDRIEGQENREGWRDEDREVERWRGEDERGDGGWREGRRDGVEEREGSRDEARWNNPAEWDIPPQTTTPPWDERSWTSPENSPQNQNEWHQIADPVNYSAPNSYPDFVPSNTNLGLSPNAIPRGREPIWYPRASHNIEGYEQSQSPRPIPMGSLYVEERVQTTVMQDTGYYY